MGGLGFRKAKVTNLGFQLKLLWKIIAIPDNFWVTLVHKKYLRNESLWSYSPSRNSSWQWRNLMRLRPIIKRGFKWQLGNGKKSLTGMIIGFTQFLFHL